MLRSLLITKATYKMLETNRRTLQCLKGERTTGISDGRDDESIQHVLERILAKPKYKDERARNLDFDDDFYRLSQRGDPFAS
jgi:hypothetical protein